MLKNTINHLQEKCKIRKTIKNNYLSSKNFWNSVDLKSMITEHPKTSHILYKAITQCEKYVLIALHVAKGKVNIF